MKDYLITLTKLLLDDRVSRKSDKYFFALNVLFMWFQNLYAYDRILQEK